MTKYVRTCVAVGLSLAAISILIAASEPPPATVPMGSQAEQAEAEAKDIVDTAVAAGSFKTLVTALKAADLVETLKGEGPFTVFAPDDDAFAKLPAGTLTDLLRPENKAKLASILTYHVAAGKLMAADVVKKDSIETVQGSPLKVKCEDDKVMVDGAIVTKTDIECSNGVIHVIDAVVTPPEPAKAED